MDSAVLEQLIKSLLAPVTAKLKHFGLNRILEYQINECRNCLSVKTLLHKVQAANLFEIYTPLRIAKRHSEIFEKSEDFLSIDDYADIRSFLETNKFLNIQGLAGSGKSTITKYLFIFAIKDQFKIPIKIDLRDFNSYVTSARNDNLIFDFLKNSIFQFQNLSPVEDSLLNMLKDGNFIFLFDGFDEVSSDLAGILVNDLERFAGRYSENNFVITSRPFTISENLSLFKNYWLKDFDMTQVYEFIGKQNLEKQLEDSIKKTIASVNNNEYISLFKNPLLLTMFILTYGAYPNVPVKKSEYYSQVFEALYSMHDSLSKLGYVRKFNTQINKQEFRSILDSFSFISYYDNLYDFDDKYLFHKLEYVKNSNTSLVFEPKDFIDDLLISAGLLYQEGLYLKFIHKSLQEYFAAAFVCNLNEDSKRSYFNKIITNMLSEEKPLFTEFYNFYSLIYEMDEIGVITYFEIPLFKKLVQMLEVGLTVNQFFSIIPGGFITYEYARIQKTRYRQVRKNNGRFDAQIYSEDRGWIMLSDSLNEIIQKKESIINESVENQKGIIEYALLTKRSC